TADEDVVRLVELAGRRSLASPRLDEMAILRKLHHAAGAVFIRGMTVGNEDVAVWRDGNTGRPIESNRTGSGDTGLADVQLSSQTSPGQRVCNTIVLEKQQKNWRQVSSWHTSKEVRMKIGNRLLILHLLFIFLMLSGTLANAQSYRGEAVPVVARSNPIEFSRLRFLTFVFGR